MLATALSLAPRVLSVVVVLLVAVYCWALWKFRHQIREAEKLPCLFPRYPVVGNLPYTIGSLEKLGRLAEGMWIEAADRGLDTICFWIGPIPLILVLKADEIGKILNSSKSLTKSVEQETLVKDFIGSGLITAPASHWKLTRRHMNPVFNSQNLDLMMSTINQNCRELVSRLARESRGQAGGDGTVELFDNIMNTTLKTACYLTLGQTIDIDSKDFQALKQVNKWIPDILLSRILKLWLRFDSVYNLLLRKTIKETKDAWKQFADSRVKIAKERYSLNKTINEVGKDDGNNYGKSFMTVVDAYSSLQDNYPTITDKNLNEELLTIATAGSDSMSAAVASCLLAIAQFSNVQDKVYEEISSVVEPGRDVTMEDLQKLPYLDQVVKEAMRLLTVVPFVSRRSTEDVKLRSCTIPAGSAIYLCLAGVHLDPKVYPEPTTFDPEHFSLDVDRSSYIAFGGGPRACIGRTYSYTSMKCMIIHVLLRFRLTTEMDIYKLRRKLSIVMASVDGYNVTLHDRA